MARIFPFAALRPTPQAAAAVAAVPYDVVSTDEARALAADNPLSFLHVSRAEIDLPPGTDPHSDQVYERASENFRDLQGRARRWSSRMRRPFTSTACRWARTCRPGIAACFSIDEYDDGVDQEAREDAARQGRRSHAPHAGARRADRTGVPDLSRRRRALDEASSGRSAADAAVRLHGARRCEAYDLEGGRRARTRKSIERRSPRFLRSTSPTAITARRARRARAGRSPGAAPANTIACSRSRFPTTRCRFFPTTASSRI